MELEKLRKKVEKHYYKYFKIGNCELSKEDAENIQWGVDIVKSILFGVGISKRKTINNFLEIANKIVENTTVYDTNKTSTDLGELTQYIVDNYEIKKK